MGKFMQGDFDHVRQSKSKDMIDQDQVDKRSEEFKTNESSQKTTVYDILW